MYNKKPTLKKMVKECWLYVVARYTRNRKMVYLAMIIITLQLTTGKRLINKQNPDRKLLLNVY